MQLLIGEKTDTNPIITNIDYFIIILYNNKALNLRKARRKGKGEGMAKVKRERTEREKKRLIKKLIIIFVSIFLIIGVVFASFAIAAAVSVKKTNSLVAEFGTADYKYMEIAYAGNQLKPVIDSDGYYTFTTDDPFRICLFNDLHIGAGAFSGKKDRYLFNALEAMIRYEKPDLVIFNGDSVYPVPFQAGTSNNMTGAEMLSDFMENIGVYWTLTFGNHDTESYSRYDREAISQFYEGLRTEKGYKYCLFQQGPDNIAGYGNSIIKVKNSKGLVSQALILMDSHSYIESDKFGVKWDYDNIKDNQVDWYAGEIQKLNTYNQAKLATLELGPDAAENFKTVKSLAFFHIPLDEFRQAYLVYKDKGDTEDVKYVYGQIKEKGKFIYSGSGEDQVFEKALELGSTKGFFFGHDHYNDLSLEYRGIRFTYGKALDYLAYIGIAKEGAQRGCTIVRTYSDGSFDNYTENYYQDKYQAMYEKEKVKMQWFDVAASYNPPKGRDK